MRCRRGHQSEPRQLPTQKPLRMRCAAILKAQTSFTGNLVQDKAYAINCTLRWDEARQLVSGSIDFPELKASKSLEGFIVDNRIDPPYLQLIETGPLKVDPRSGALVGITYRLTTNVQRPSDSVIKTATYGDPATGRVADVTDQVRALVRRHALNVKVNGGDFKIGDPAYGVIKSLTIECLAADGKPSTLTAKEGAMLSIENVSGPAGVLGGLWSYRANTLAQMGQQFAGGMVSLKPADVK